LETKLDSIENILDSRTLKEKQFRDEVFDKPAEFQDLRVTSGVFHQAVHRQLKTETRIKRATTTQFKFTSNVAAILLR
jgi:hypothetical protein